MSTVLSSNPITFIGDDQQRLRNLCGPCNENLTLIEARFNVKISHSNNRLCVQGASDATKNALDTMMMLYQRAETPLTTRELNAMTNQKNHSSKTSAKIQTRHKSLVAKNAKQTHYLGALEKHVVNFAIGPAGTGKTYLSVAKAVEALESAKVERLIFVRPAVEAGEKLGFLPGDMVEKVLPYLRPIYDALYEMLGVETVEKLLSRDTIEIAPLAFMRGRTLNDAFVILDEAQNTTIAQMRMFLTRLGFSSKMVITGDMTQTDLPKSQQSGLAHAVNLMKDFSEVGLTEFDAADVVRHQLVSKIIQAYDNDKSS